MVVTPNLKKQPFVFLDFDGTITEKDSLLAIMEAFAPEGWTRLKEQILSRRISVRRGVGEMFSLIPSDEKEKIVAFVKREVKIREGFSEFLDFCRDGKIEFKIVSGGLDYFVYPLLEPYLSRDRILCNSADFSSSAIRVLWNYPCDSYCHLDCGFCKASLIRTYDPSLYRRVLVGDSVTDFAAAEIADAVIARDHLLKQCEETGIPVTPFKNFFEVIKRLNNG